MTDKDLYVALGVDKKASQDQIKKAFRDLAKKHHPDKHKGNKKAEERFKEISGAYDVLGDPEKRKKYDEMRDAMAHGFQGFSGGAYGRQQTAAGYEDLFGGGRGAKTGGWSDFFSDLFGRRFKAERASMKGRDLDYAIEIPFRLAVKGGKTALTFPRTEDCPKCHGSGAAPGATTQACPTCHGSGSVQEHQGGFAFSRVCPTCLGRGKTVDHPCPECAGAGEISRKRRVEVKIPKGVDDGARIRVAGMGDRGEGGGPPGDLIITLRVKTPTGFERKGLDVYSDVTITLTQALLGAKLETDTVHGAVTVTIPPGTQPGATLRLKGKGMSKPSGAAGDHYLRIEVRLPRELTDEQKKIVEELARTGA